MNKSERRKREGQGKEKKRERGEKESGETVGPTVSGGKFVH